MTKRRFKQVDVFTGRPFFGNPVAVVIDSDGLTTDDMQRIARWTNLSETTFLLAPTRAGADAAADAVADYRLRIFTPGSELPFAGHPTVGSAHAAIEAGLVPPKARLVQECAAGLLDIEVTGDGAERRIAVTAPIATLTSLAPAHVAALGDALGAAWAPGMIPTTVNVGPSWLIVQMADGPAVSALAPDMAKLDAFSRAHGLTGVSVFGLLGEGKEAAINVRAFAPAQGVPEDPVCGSGNASVGAYIGTRADLARLLPGYRASQGREIGRDGYVDVQVRDGRVRIGGQSVTCVDGHLTT